MTACPNPNDENWIRLVKQVGHDLAEKAFIANGYEVPDVPTITEIKKELGYRKTMPDNQVKFFANKVRIYNAKHGTSHSFTPITLYGDTVEIKMHLNYLPVNIEKQRQRDAQREEPLRVENNEQAERAFQILYDIRPGKFEQKADGYFDENGDFKPLADQDIDYLVPTAGAEVKAVEKQRRLKIDRDIYKLRTELLKAVQNGEQEKIQSLGEQINKLRALIDKADARVSLADKIISFEDIAGSDETIGYGGKQLAEVEQILNKRDITHDDIEYCRRTVDLWLAAGDFKGDPTKHIFLDEDEFNTPEIREIFQGLRNKAEALDSMLFQIEKNLVVELVRKHTNKDLTPDEIFADIKDINSIAGQTLALLRHNDPMVHTIASAIEQQNTKAKLASNEIWKTADELGKKAQKKSDNFEMYRQKTEDGLYTNKIVSRFSPEFFTERERLWNAAFETVDAKGKKKNPEAIKRYFEWVKDNTITFDPRALFPDSLGEEETTDPKFLYTSVTFEDKATQEHIATLKSHLGEKGFEEYHEKLRKKIERFKLERQIVYTSLQNEPISETEKEVRMNDWLKEHSPYWGIEMVTNKELRKKGDSFYKATGLKEYGVSVPLKTINGKPTKWYDKNFEKIEQDPDLYAFYQFFIGTVNDLNKVLPHSKREAMKFGAIPTLEKSLVELFSQKGMGVGINVLWDKFKELQTTTDLASTISNDINPNTKEIRKEINVSHVVDFGPEIDKRANILRIKHEQATGKPPTADELRRFKQIAADEISKEHSWDLIKVLKAYSLTTLAYKHKAEIEPQVRMLNRAFNSRKEIETTRAGKTRTTVSGNLASKEGLSNYKKAIEFFLDADYFSIGSRKVQGISSKKVLTSEEKTKKKELEALLEKEEDPFKREFLKEQIEDIGKFRTMSATFDMLLKYMTYKNLGWNIGSAFSNLGFGFISNVIQASDGREFTLAQMRRAQLLTVNSIARNLSFNSWDAVNTNALKIRTLMDNWHLMNTSNNEMYQTSVETASSKLKRFSPMSLQERTEYLNYAPIMIATLMNFPAKDANGNDVTLWDALGVDGKLKDGYTAEFDEVRLVQRIKRSIEATHGDYNNPLAIKSTIQGRAISQFRTWMFEGFANRFEAEKPDWDLSYGMSEPYIRKGRYRSYTAGQLVTAGAVLGTTLLPGIGTIALAGTGYFVGKFAGLSTKETVLGDTLFTLKQLARKLIFQKTQFGDRFTAHDAANMRKNMTELYMLMGIAGITLLLRASIDDEEEKKDVKTVNFLLNQMTRLQTDIGFYTNPLEAEKLTQTAVPMASLVKDVGEWFSSVGTLLNDDPDDQYFQAPSPFEGASKPLIKTFKMIPGASIGVKLVSTTSQVFADK